jgi:carboxymethylenebutenolidase
MTTRTTRNPLTRLINAGTVGVIGAIGAIAMMSITLATTGTCDSAYAQARKQTQDQMPLSACCAAPETNAKASAKESAKESAKANAKTSIKATAKATHNASHTQFASLASAEDFRRAHLEPLPFVLEGGTGTMVSVNAADGSSCNGYEVKPTAPADAKTSKSVVFMIHEWWGLNDHIKREAEQLSKELGVRVIALDLYDKKVGTTREEAGKLMGGLSAERAKTIVRTFQSYVGTDVKVGTVGWCMGGTWSMQSSILLGKQAAACVIYYGQPEMKPDVLAAFNPPTLGIFASKDKWITPEMIGKFEKEMATAKKPLEVKMYDADHAFANPSNPQFNKPFADEAHALTLAFFKKHLF